VKRTIFKKTTDSSNQPSLFLFYKKNPDLLSQIAFVPSGSDQTGTLFISFMEKPGTCVPYHV
jgi:hypothetical protein